MAARFLYFRRTLIRTLAGASLAGLGLVALAKEPVVVRSASGATTPSAAAAAASSPAATREAASDAQVRALLDTPKRAVRLPSSQDPLDRVRERLEQRLGAPRAVAAPDANTVRVATRAPVAEAAAASEPRVRPLRRAAPALTARPAVLTMADGLAASHRAGAATLDPTRLAADPAHWDYAGGSAGAGPDQWGALRPEFSKCSTGSRQSPIDIRDGIKVDLEPVAFDYKPSVFRVVDNGHTVQVNVGPGNSIDVAGRRYDLVQFHFHRPSEERVNGKQFDMVAHLVHRDIDGRLAVVAVLLERGPAHPLVQSVWNNLPLEKGDEIAARATLDLNTLLPTERSYFTYMGSLTTPPCSEGVLWMVMKAPMLISADQINIFARLYPMNARPIQPASGRLIKESN